MKRGIVKVFVMNVFLLSALACILGTMDSAFQQVYPSTGFLSYPINALKYFLFWMLPYWWIMIIFGAIVLTLLYGVLKK